MKKMRKIFCVIILMATLPCCTDKIIDEMNRSNQVIEDKINENADRITAIEDLCSMLNTNISSLKVLLDAAQGEDWVKSVTPIKDAVGSVIGYTLDFAKSGIVTIYNGKNGLDGKDGDNGKDGTDGKDGQNGADGQNGKDGADGKDGYTPKLEIRKDIDGQYYWALDDDWMRDSNGDRIPALGVTGNTPQLRIVEGYWEVSYDKGVTWNRIGRATGTDGTSFFSDVNVSDEGLFLTLTDGTLLTFPKYQQPEIVFSVSDESVGAYSGIEVNINYTLKYKSSGVAVTASSDGNYSVKVVKVDENSGRFVVAPPTKYVDGYINVLLTDSYGFSLLKVINFHENKIDFPKGLEYSISQDGGQLNIPISMNFDMDIKLNSDWLAMVANTKAAMRDSSIVVSALKNDTFGSRKASINIYSKTNNYQPYAEIIVNQASASFSISQTKFALPYLQSSEKVEVYSSIGLNVAVNQGSEWLSVDTLKNGYNYSLSISALKNDTGEKRSGTITLYSDKNERLGAIQVIQMSEDSDSPDDMVFTVRANVPNDFTVELPLDGEIDAYVDWGDGSVDYCDSKPVKHRYETDTPTSYVVKISGKVTALNSERINAPSIVEVNQWGKTGLKSLRCAFINNPLLTKVSFGENDVLTSVTDAYAVFASCYNLKYVTGDLFDGLSNLKDVSRAFADCQSLEKIPENLLRGCVSVENVNYMFQSCFAVAAIPSGLFNDCTCLRQGTALFEHCTSVTKLPAELFKNNTELLNLNYAFYNCASLTEIPIDIFDCNRKINAINNLFSGCRSVYGESPYSLVDGVKVHLYERNQFRDYFSYIGEYSCAFSSTSFDDFDKIPNSYK